MRVTVHVVPRAKQIGVEKRSDGSLRIKVSAPPVDGKATAAVIEQLSHYFSCAKTRIRLITGAASRTKIFEISI